LAAQLAATQVSPYLRLGEGPVFLPETVHGP